MANNKRLLLIEFQLLMSLLANDDDEVSKAIEFLGVDKLSFLNKLPKLSRKQSAESKNVNIVSKFF